MADHLELIETRTNLSARQIARLEALVSEWQLLADLSFSDLVLWVRDAHEGEWLAVEQIRPATGPTTLMDDIVGTRSQDPFGSGVVWLNVGDAGSGEPIARVSRHRHAVSMGAGEAVMSPLEHAYWDAFCVLVDMLTRGEYPDIEHPWKIADSLRVGDGFIRLNAAGRIEYASPNATSTYRRLGHEADLMGELLVPITSALVTSRPTDRGFGGLFGPYDEETELVLNQSTLLVRVCALRDEGGSQGWVVLVRDVTELRMRERELISKDATIREIHHRVKNNLQTVAALLRLQSRRLDIPEARSALAEAERRVGSIALVHETLSKSFDDNVEFDEIADVLLRTVLDVGGARSVRGERIGSFGTLPSEVATPLAMVLTEVVQNATEHAFVGRASGQVTVAVNRIKNRLRLRISDNGVGLPHDFDPTRSLGLSIVSTLVEGELGGTLSYEKSPAAGTTVAISLDL
jgi:two-component sensor histidine kinase